MAVSQQDTIDFTVMYATHDAFRRDLDRLKAAVAVGRADVVRIREGWENFKTQLLVHHTVEDSDLWPRLRHALVGRPEDLTLLDEMEAEHARIDPLLVAVDKALSGDPGLADRIGELSSALDEHLTHEEESALPLIQSTLTSADWRAFRGAMARRQRVKGAAVYVPWVIDGVSPADRRRFLSCMPAPLRIINKISWEPRYQKRNLWNS